MQIRGFRSLFYIDPVCISTDRSARRSDCSHPRPEHALVEHSGVVTNRSFVHVSNNLHAARRMFRRIDVPGRSLKQVPSLT